MCGILGLILAEGIAPGSLTAIALDSLTSLQHRGTESSGLVGSNGVHRDHFEIAKGCGLVKDAFTDESLCRLNESVAVLGHNRYSTAGMKGAINCVQPFVVHTAIGLIAIAHNGELVDAKQKRTEVLNAGVGLSTDTDSELIGQIISKALAINVKCRTDESSFGDICKELAVTMSSLRMSYSLLVMTYDRIYALRDIYGNRPLCVGTLYNSNDDGTSQPYAYMAASESCALPSTATLQCEVKPGEIVEISRKGIKSVCQMKPATPAFCIFEYIYFARCDSVFEGQQVQSVRKECGRILAEESGVDADIVSTVPDSAISASIGFAEKSGIRYEQVLHRNSYVGRSFIQPNTEMRKASVIKKFGVISGNVAGKRIVLIDDSIVRGNTMGIIVRTLKEHGAKEVHLRIASPPVKYPCFMGINIPSSSELIAANRSIDQIRDYVGADSVRYLSVEGLQRAVTAGIELQPNYETGHCTACLTGKYPVHLEW